VREKWIAVGIDEAMLCRESALVLLEVSDNVADAVLLLAPPRHRGQGLR
jgi:hypothetical protein